MTHFELEIHKLKDHILRMASHSKNSVIQGIRALREQDYDLGMEVEENDNQIDQYEIEIDEMAINILAKAPLAKDLRFITVALKISMELERIGDEATTIARRAMELSKEPRPRDMQGIDDMVDRAVNQLNDSITSFAEENPNKAKAIIPSDKELDKLYKNFKATMVEMIKQDVSRVSYFLDMIVISKSLERIGDHATNIAEEIVYMHEAKDIRHSNSML